MTNDTSKTVITRTAPSIQPKRQDGRHQARKLVGTDKVVTGSGYGGLITQSQIGAGAIGQSQLKYEQKTVTVLATATTGTVTVTAGDIIIGYYASTNQDQFIKSIAISSTTLTITLLNAATANNVFVVTLLKS